MLIIHDYLESLLKHIVSLRTSTVDVHGNYQCCLSLSFPNSLRILFNTLRSHIHLDSTSNTSQIHSHLSSPSQLLALFFSLSNKPSTQICTAEVLMCVRATTETGQHTRNNSKERWRWKEKKKGRKERRKEDPTETNTHRFRDQLNSLNSALKYIAH